MRVLMITLSLLLLMPGLESPRSRGEPDEAQARRRSAHGRKVRRERRHRRRRQRARRRRRARPSPRPAKTATPQTWHERWVAKTYGAATLEKLRRMGVTAKVFWYANQNALAGIKRLAKGKYEDGFYLLNKAYKLVRSPNILHHLARANEAIGRLLRSREQYVAFLREAPRWKLTAVSRAAQKKAREQLARLQQRLVSLHLEVNVKGALLFLDGRLRGKSPFAKPFWVRPGRTVRVVLLRDGYRRVEKTLRYKAGGAEHRIEVEMLTNAEAIRRDKRFQEMQRRKAAAERRRRTIQRRLELERAAVRSRRVRRQRTLRISGWVGLAMGTASLILGGVFAILAEKEFNQTVGVAVNTPWPDVEPSFERSKTYRTVAYAALGTGAALAIGGAVLLYLGYRRHARETAHRPGEKAGLWDRLRLLPQVGRRSTGLSAELSF